MIDARKYGPWALIAGASEGTGRAYARQLAQAGLSLILIARRPGPLEALVAEIATEFNVECVVGAIDLAKPDAFDRLLETVGEREVGLYIGNAGSDPNGSRFLDLDVQCWLDLVQRNVVNTIQCAHYFGGKMARRGRGGLLFVNSYGCYGGGSFIATYSATKAAELCLAEGLWAELRPLGVSVLTLAMGVTDTPELRRLLAQTGRSGPGQMADAEEVAAFGLANLENGPVQNWALAEDEAGHLPNSAADRRRRVEMIDESTRSIFDSDGVST